MRLVIWDAIVRIITSPYLLANSAGTKRCRSWKPQHHVTTIFSRTKYEHSTVPSIWPQLNSLTPGRPVCHFKTPILNLVFLIGISTSSKDNALRWMPRDLTDDKSTLVQVMAWYRQTTSHYLSQCWPSSMSLYGAIRPQWFEYNIFG